MNSQQRTLSTLAALLISSPDPTRAFAWELDSEHIGLECFKDPEDALEDAALEALTALHGEVRRALTDADHDASGTLALEGRSFVLHIQEFIRSFEDSGTRAGSFELPASVTEVAARRGSCGLFGAWSGGGDSGCLDALAWIGRSDREGIPRELEDAVEDAVFRNAQAEVNGAGSYGSVLFLLRCPLNPPEDIRDFLNRWEFESEAPIPIPGVLYITTQLEDQQRRVEHTLRFEVSHASA